MMESLGKVSEVVDKAKDLKTTTFNPDMEFDPDKRVEKSEVVAGKQNEGFDPDKRMDKTALFTGGQKKEFDPDKSVEKADGNDGESKEIHTRNEDLEGKNHPVTGVPFDRKTVTDSEGNEVDGVFPVFDSEYDAQLPESLYKASDKEQFAECNKQLKEAVEKDPELAKKFTPEQLEQIKNGDTPDGYTWHHNEKTGKMQLVDSDTHAKTGHTGGKTIWGGGNENR